MSESAQVIVEYEDYAPLSLFEIVKARRGWDDVSMSELSAVPHEQLKRLDDVVDRLHECQVHGQQVTIVPDFDTDGVTAGTLGYAGLAQLGFMVNLYVPDYRRGHDIVPETIDECVSQFPLTDVIMTCDAGINSHAGIARAHEHGVKVFVTDHHVELSPGCSADVWVNPNALDEDYPDSHLCGAAVMFLVIRRYAKRFAPEMLPLVELLRLFAGVGTVADVMPLRGQSRGWVSDAVSLSRLLFPHGDGSSVLVESLRSFSIPAHPVLLTAFEGFEGLLRLLRSRGKLKSVGYIDSTFFAFYIAPMINSLRRVGAEFFAAFSAFNHPSADAREDAAEILFDANELRKHEVVRFVDELADSEQPFAPFVFVSDAPTGMLGLVATSLSNESGLPVCVVNAHADGSFSGSARAPEWFDVIAQCATVDVSAVGHAQACGVSFDSAEDVSRVCDVFARSVAEHEALSALEPVSIFDVVDVCAGSSARCDVSLSDTAAFIDLVDRCELYKPFGVGFTEPVVGVEVDMSTVSLITLGAKKQHVKMSTPEGFVLLWWNAADEYGDRLAGAIADSSTVVFATHVGINEFRQKVSAQGVIQSVVNWS